MQCLHLAPFQYSYVSWTSSMDVGRCRDCSKCVRNFFKDSSWCSCVHVMLCDTATAPSSLFQIFFCQYTGWMHFWIHHAIPTSLIFWKHLISLVIYGSILVIVFCTEALVYIASVIVRIALLAHMNVIHTVISSHLSVSSWQRPPAVDLSLTVASCSNIC